MALRYCKLRGALLIGITNTVGSSICHESHCGAHINAGPGIGVASPKAYTSQMLSLLMFALSLMEDRISASKRCKEIIHALKQPTELIKEVLATEKDVLEIARRSTKPRGSTEDQGAVVHATQHH